jgi:hypothetical protein
MVGRLGVQKTLRCRGANWQLARPYGCSSAVFHGLGILVPTKLLARKTEWEQELRNHGLEENPCTIPAMTFQSCDCSFGRQQAESQLRTLMEQQMSTP